MRWLGLLMVLGYAIVGILILLNVIQVPLGKVQSSALSVLLIGYSALRFFKWKSKYEE